MHRLLAIFLLAILPASACLWDRDTLRDEARGKLDTAKAITGWFDRYPPKYYEMRLERVTKELSADPKALDLYDDAGVACSRLGRHDEAIAWMVKKRAVLDALPEAGPTDDDYRYYSNIGTFYLIRWIVRPEVGRSADLGDLKASKDLIARALEVNPDAHFGREKFQLMLIRWLLGEAPRSLDGLSNNFLYLPPKHQGKVTFTPEEARQGITGLIQLGAAWESIDSYFALGYSLRAQNKWHFAYLAALRHEELVSAGKTSFQPDPGVRKRIEPQLMLSTAEDTIPVTEFYRKARAAAGKRGTAWLAYQQERYAKGMHPDTHADFWKGWKEPAFPKMPGPTLAERFLRNPFLWMVAAVVLLYLLQFVPRLLRRRSKKALAAAPA